MIFSSTYTPLLQFYSQKITFYLIFPTRVTIDKTGLYKSLPNKTILFYPTDFYLLGNLLEIIQNHSKPFKTIER